MIETRENFNQENGSDEAERRECEKVANDPNRCRLCACVRLDNNRIWEYYFDSSNGSWIYQPL